MLSSRSQSAGNDKTAGTSETIRNEIVPNKENIKPISIHVPKHSFPINDEQFGHYLAGIIDGNGNFNILKQLEIVFSAPDAFLAYKLRTRIGYGNISKINNKKIYLLVISNEKGIIKVLNLINGKVRNRDKYNQIVSRVLIDSYLEKFNKEFTLNTYNNYYNHWLAGFSDADASFQIKIVSCTTRKTSEVILNFEIDKKKEYILQDIRNFLGGNIGYRTGQDTYYYGSTSFGSAKSVINYFDKFHLQGKKHLSYLR